MTGVVVAILAHDARPALDELVANLRAFAPAAEIVVFNGGSDPSFLDGVDARPLRSSKPLRYGNSSPFHLRTFRELVTSGTDFDYCVTIDGDVALLRPGLEEGLERIMGDAQYMAARFSGVADASPDEVTRRYRWQAHAWRRLLGADALYRGFNPAQVFGRAFVERILALPSLPAIEDHLDRARMYAADELVWATLAVVLDAAPVSNPGSHALLTRTHPRWKLEEYAADPDVFFVHKVSMDPDGHDRRFVRELIDGRPRVPPAETRSLPPGPANARWRAFAKARFRDVGALSEVVPFSARVIRGRTPAS